MQYIHLYQYPVPDEEDLISCAGPYDLCINYPDVKVFALLQYVFRRTNVTDLFDAILMLAIAFCDTHVPSYRRIQGAAWLDKRCDLPSLLRHIALRLDDNCDAIRFNYGNISQMISKRIVDCWFHYERNPLSRTYSYQMISVTNLLETFSKYISIFVLREGARTIVCGFFYD